MNEPKTPKMREKGNGLAVVTLTDTHMIPSIGGDGLLCGMCV